MDKEIRSIEDLDQRQLVEYALDMLHRLMVHHTLWFREVEHQLGLARALQAMDNAWQETRRIMGERWGQALNFTAEDGVPTALAALPREKQLAFIDAIAKNWLAQDGVWFQVVERQYGMKEAKRCNDSTWSRFSPLEAHAVKKLLQLGDRPGLAGLERALAFRMYGRLNRQRCVWQEGALIFRMENCRVQSARQRRNLPDYPCKSAGLVEYACFAEGIDDRIRTECLGCPPDDHPTDWFCAWRFTLE